MEVLIPLKKVLEAPNMINVPIYRDQLNIQDYIKKLVTARAQLGEVQFNLTQDQPENEENLRNVYKSFTLSADFNMLSTSMVDPGWEKMLSGILKPMEREILDNDAHNDPGIIHTRVTFINAEDEDNTFTFLSSPNEVTKVSTVGMRENRIRTIIRHARRAAARFGTAGDLWFVNVASSYRYLKIPENVIFEDGATIIDFKRKIN